MNWNSQLFINKMSFQKCRRMCSCNDGAFGCFLSLRENNQWKSSPLFTWIRKLCEILQVCVLSLGMMLSNSLLLQYSWNEKLLATVETSCSPFICDTYYPKHLGNLILSRKIVIYFHASTKRFLDLELKLSKPQLYSQTFQNFRSKIAGKHPVISGIKASAADCILP